MGFNKKHTFAAKKENYRLPVLSHEKVLQPFSDRGYPLDLSVCKAPTVSNARPKYKVGNFSEPLFIMESPRLLPLPPRVRWISSIFPNLLLSQLSLATLNDSRY
ncbi:hypothetical protein HHUSO_G4741 [Huso huso]|uniref:Uncharacterized protein n=1 Tax=Huso huso TaxID=61971 RepID=A0ABR0ZZL5_HUSHU